MTGRLNVKETALKKGIDTPYKLQKAAGLSPTNASKLFHGTATMISLRTLARLCETLACEPNDLLLVTAGQSDAIMNGEY